MFYINISDLLYQSSAKLNSESSRKIQRSFQRDINIPVNLVFLNGPVTW